MKGWISTLDLPFIFVLTALFLGALYYLSKSLAHEWRSRKAISNHGEGRHDVILDYYHKPDIFAALLVSIVLIGFAGSVSSIRGEAAAIRQKTFLVTNTVPEMIVLKIYGDNFLCSEFDRKSKTISNKFSYFKVSDKMSTSFISETIGPLVLTKDVQ